MAMSKERREQVALEKTALIREAALALFDQKGYREATIEEIARLAGISKGLVYKYFASKKEILKSFEEDIYQCGITLREQPTPMDSLRMAAERVLLPYEQTGYHSPMRILIICYMQGDISDEELSYEYALKNYGRTEFGPFFRKGQELGQFRAGDSEQMGDLFWHLMIGYAMHKVQPGQDLVGKQTIEEMLALFRT